MPTSLMYFGCKYYTTVPGYEGGPFQYEAFAYGNKILIQTKV